MASPPPLACSVEGCEWTTPPNVPTWELITTLMGQHTQAVHPAGGQGPEDNIMKMDRCSVEKIKLSRFGFKWNLIGFSSFLSILGIVVSTLGTIGSIATIATGIGLEGTRRGGLLLIIIGIPIVIIMTLYLAMWIFLKKKTNKRDITGIERIGKIYSYVSGALEIIAMACCLYASVVHFSYHGSHRSYSFGFSTRHGENVFILVFATIDLIFTSLQIHGIRHEKNILLGIYLVYRYAFFLLTNVITFIGAIYAPEIYIGPLIVQVLFFILDIGLTVILHSIREDRGGFVGMENPLKDF